MDIKLYYGGKETSILPIFSFPVNLNIDFHHKYCEDLFLSILMINPILQFLFNFSLERFVLLAGIIFFVGVIFSKLMIISFNLYTKIISV